MIKTLEEIKIKHLLHLEILKGSLTHFYILKDIF